MQVVNHGKLSRSGDLSGGGCCYWAVHADLMQDEIDKQGVRHRLGQPVGDWIRRGSQQGSSGVLDALHVVLQSGQGIPSGCFRHSLLVQPWKDTSYKSWECTRQLGKDNSQSSGAPGNGACKADMDATAQVRLQWLHEACKGTWKCKTRAGSDGSGRLGTSSRSRTEYRAVRLAAALHMLVVSASSFRPELCSCSLFARATTASSRTARRSGELCHRGARCLPAPAVQCYQLL